MTSGDLGDVVVRARGLAQRLLRPAQLRQLARVAGPGALARALERAGYWPAPSPGPTALSAAAVVERSIDHETLRRQSILVRWLAERSLRFAPMLELEVLDTLRVRLRALAGPAAEDAAAARPMAGGWPELEALRRTAAAAPSLRALVRGLTRLRSPYAPGLGEALRRSSASTRALEAALEATWSARARHAASRSTGPLRRWVEDEIDLRNAWSAWLGSGSDFVEGGRNLGRAVLEAVSAERDEREKRRRLARALDRTRLAGVFDDPDLAGAALEARARVVRIEGARRAGRLDPIGEAPIVEVLLRLRAERAALRCIGWGVASGLDTRTIVSQLALPGGAAE